MNSDNQNPAITTNFFKEFNEIGIEPKKPYEINAVLQVLKTAEGKDNNQKLFSCLLSDTVSKVTVYIIKSSTGNEKFPKVNDLIRIQSMTLSPTNQTTVALVKKFSIVGSLSTLVGNPEFFTLKLMSDVKDKAQANSSKSKQVKPATNHNNRDSNQDNHNHRDEESNVSEKKTKIFIPLSQLSTFSKDIHVKVRITKKGELKTWSSSKGSGKVFALNVHDEEGYEMQINAFNKAAEKLYDMFEENKVYEIEGGYIKLNDKKYSTIKTDYKIVMDETTKVIEHKDDGSIKSNSFNFINLDEMKERPIYSFIDLAAYVLEITEKNIKMTKNGEIPMRKVLIGDDTHYKIEFTLWKAFTDLEIKPGDVLWIKNARIGEFNGKNLSSHDETTIVINAPYKEAFELGLKCSNYKGEYMSLQGKSSENDQESKNTTISYLKDCLNALDNHSDDKVGLFKVKGTVVQLIHNSKNFYCGCPDSNCKKKLIEESYGLQCPGCNKMASNPTYYYTLSVRVKDSSNEYWVDIFGNLGERILGIPASEYKNIIDANQEDRLKELTQFVEFKEMYFLLKPKFQIYNNNSKKKLNAYRIDNIDPITDTKRQVKLLYQTLNIME